MRKRRPSLDRPEKWDLIGPSILLPQQPNWIHDQQPEGAPQSYGFYTQESEGAPPPQQYGGYAQQPAEAPPPYGETSGYSTQPGMGYYGQSIDPGGQPVMTQPMTNAYGPNQNGHDAHAQNTSGAQIDPNDPSMNERSVRMKCPKCQAEITTSTEHVVGSCTWLCCWVLCAMGFFICCFCPFLMNGYKDVIHTCPSCKAEVGRFVRQKRSNVRISAGGPRHRGHFGSTTTSHTGHRHRHGGMGISGGFSMHRHGGIGRTGGFGSSRTSGGHHGSNKRSRGFKSSRTSGGNRSKGIGGKRR